MLELRNRTPFAADLLPWIDREGDDELVVVVKGTFDLSGPGAAPRVSHEQVPIQREDAHHGEPGASSVRFAADAGPTRLATDVVLVGHAYPPGGRAAGASEVILQAGPVRKIVQVFGDRQWFRTMGSWAISDPPRSFERMPLVWERAYGGADHASPDPAQRAEDLRNPVGTGFTVDGSTERLEDLPLPNLEDPRALIARWRDRPEPAGFGFVAPHWDARRRWAGTYDDAWKRDRFPRLPVDFDERFFGAAPVDQQVRPRLRGGEPVAVAGASAEHATLAFALPAAELRAAVVVRGKRSEHAPALDTVLIEPDERRVVLTWRATIPCPRALLHVDRVVVTAGAIR